MRTKSYLQHALFADTAIDEYNEPHFKDPETGAMCVVRENKDSAHNSVKDSEFGGLSVYGMPSLFRTFPI